MRTENITVSVGNKILIVPCVCSNRRKQEKVVQGLIYEKGVDM